MRRQRRVAFAAAVASAVSGAPSITHAALTSGGLRGAADYTVHATSVIGTMVPPGRPGFVRGALVHVAISAAAGEAFAALLPRRHATLWGLAAGTAMGVVNLGVIARRYYPAVAELPLLPQIADNAAFGLVFGALVD